MIKRILVSLVLLFGMTVPAMAQDTAVMSDGALMALAVSGWVTAGILLLILMAVLFGYREVASMLANMIPAEHVREQTDFWHNRLKEDGQRWNDFLLPIVKAGPALWDSLTSELKTAKEQSGPEAGA